MKVLGKGVRGLGKKIKMWIKIFISNTFFKQYQDYYVFQLEGHVYIGYALAIQPDCPSQLLPYDN